jgi:hypothetical protein
MPKEAVVMARVFIVSLVVLLTLSIVPAHADEGMWPVNLLNQAPYKTWQKAGLELSPRQLYNPKGEDISDAIVQVGGGTGSFVSPEGLIVTNHHVAFGALQRQSSVEANLMDEGFLARSRADEIPAPGYKAYVLKDVREVTQDVVAKVNDKMTDLERFKTIEKARKTVVEKAEKNKDIEARVVEFYGGREYHLYTYMKIKDVRIVYAPPGALGVYGGETDNWMWPRHTADFSFLRAYVAPDGTTAEYATDNVPYKPQHHLPFSVAPLRDGDFTMVMGYPGRTSRHNSSYSVDYVINRYYGDRIEQYGDLIEMLEKLGEQDQEAAVRTASTVRSLANSHKNNQGMLEGLKRYNLLAQKKKQEQAMRDYISDHADAAKTYGDVLDKIAARYEDYTSYAPQLAALKRMVYWNTAMRSAYAVSKWAHERDKNDLERDSGYQDRDEDRRREALALAERRYHPVADEAILRYYLTTLIDMSATSSVPEVDRILEGVVGDGESPAIDQFVSGLYDNTNVTDKDACLDMFGKSKRDLAKMNDAMIDFAMRIVESEETLDDRYDAFQGAMSQLAPKLIAMRSMVSPTPLYPDATFTMRVSVGAVSGYSPRDAVHYDPFTTLTGVIQKHTGQDPFDAPDKLFALHKARDYGSYEDPALGDVPSCFLSTDDVTGGNSGSPILNKDGHIIGLVFDGNYEAISADYQFIPELTRTINVDSRYVLFLVDKFAEATELMEELTVVGAPERGAMR